MVRNESEAQSGDRPRHRAARACNKRRMSWTRRLVRLAVVACVTYVVVCVLTGLLQRWLIYFPSDAYSATPADVGLDFEDVAFTTSDGVTITAWSIPHPRAKGTVILCHGNGGNISNCVHSVELLHRMGLSVLVFDYRGFGRSTGTPSEQGTYRDAEAAWEYVVDVLGESPTRLILFGRSLGGAVAIELARRHPPAVLVVESSFTSLVDVGRHHFPLLPVRWLLQYRYESIDKVPDITCPKLFIHGRTDTLVPFANGRRLYEAAAEPKVFLETPGDHNEGGFTYAPEFTDRLAAFVHQALSG